MRRPIQSVARALALVDAVAVHGPGTAQSLAREANLHLPTAFHQLQTLVEGGYLAKDGRTYRLGPRIPALAAAYEQELKPEAAALEAIQRIATSLGETTYVSRWIRGDVTVVAVVDGVQAVRVADVNVGTRGHAHARASGRVLLSFAPRDRMEAYISGTALAQLTPTTITDPDRLRRELALVKRRGYAIDREQYAAGVCCISAPVLDGSGQASVALTVSAPASRFEAIMPTAVPVLLDVTRALSHGQSPSDEETSRKGGGRSDE